VRGVVTVDQSWNVRPFAEVVHGAAAGLRGDDFSAAFEPFEATMGIDHLAQPIRNQVMARRHVHRDLVLDYWDQVLETDPIGLQRRIERHAASVTAPCLAVFGHELPDDERRYMRGLMPAVEVEEWPGSGHMVHLVQPDKFASRLRAFIEQVTSVH
jgi:pimeloyl-ACP methyl ester carboxylesterase